MNKGYIRALEKEEKGILRQISVRENVLNSVKIVIEYLNAVYTKEHQILLNPKSNDE